VVLSEYVTPAAEVRYSEANLMLRGKVEGGRLISGYWFKEPKDNGGSRILNAAQLLSTGAVGDLTIYDINSENRLYRLTTAQRGVFEDGNLRLFNVTDYQIAVVALLSLAEGARSEQPLMAVDRQDSRLIETSLTPARLIARIATPEKMSLVMLLDYIGYLQNNNLDASRQVVAVWRKLAYPFTLMVMLTIAAPIAYMQTRRGGIGAKVFAGILAGTLFFMVGQLTLNMGLLYQWQPFVTALLPNIIAFALALGALLSMERRVSWFSRQPKAGQKLTAQSHS